VQLPEQLRASLSADQARAYIEQQPHGFVGGSFFASSGHDVVAPIRIC
jgi:hypothetical protein